jgi:hypothetical protein
MDSDTLPRATVTKMLVKVVTGEMPKTGTGLSLSERDTMTRDFIGVLWPGPRARAEAVMYFMEGHTFPTHTNFRINELLRARSGSSELLAPLLMTHLPPAEDRQLSPDLVMSIAVRALELCKRQGMTGTALDACVKRTMSLDGIVRRLEP